MIFFISSVFFKFPKNKLQKFVFIPFDTYVQVNRYGLRPIKAN